MFSFEPVSPQGVPKRSASLQIPPLHGAILYHNARTDGLSCAAQQVWPLDVRSGSFASHPGVRDAPGMSAMPLIATQSVRRNEASRCANSDRTHCSKNEPLFDHLVGAREQAIWHGETERLRGLEIDHQLILGWRLHGQISGLLTLEDAIDVASRMPILV